MKLPMFALSLMSFSALANWGSPYVCDPAHAEICWLFCYNSRSVMEGEMRHEIYITHDQNGSSKFQYLKETFFNPLKLKDEGTVKRDLKNPKNVDLTINKNVHLKVSIKDSEIIEDNQWALHGTMTIGKKALPATCFYESKWGMEVHMAEDKPLFPQKFYDANKIPGELYDPPVIYIPPGQPLNPQN